MRKSERGSFGGRRTIVTARSGVLHDDVARQEKRKRKSEKKKKKKTLTKIIAAGRIDEFIRNETTGFLYPRD